MSGDCGEMLWLSAGTWNLSQELCECPTDPVINLTQGQLAVLRCSLGLHALSLEAVQPKAVLATGT